MAAEIVWGSVDAFGFQRTTDEVRIMRELLDEDLNRFVQDSGIDAPAARELKSEPPEVQWAVMQRGAIRSAANPSAALVGRIRDAKRGGIGTGSRMGGSQAAVPLGPPAILSEGDRPLSDVDRFIMENRLDQSAASSLRAEVPEVQKMVMTQGPLVNCYNPSGALMGRIRSARTGQQAYRPPAPLMAPAAGAMPVLPALQNVPAPGGPPHPGGPESFGVDGGRLSEDAMKAIQKLNAGGPDAPAQDPAMLALPGPPGSTTPPGGAPPGPPVTAPANPSDARLQEEAMRAVQMLNAGGP